MDRVNTPVAMTELLCVGGEDQGQGILLRETDSIVVGRDDSADFVLTSPWLSGKHFKLEADHGAFRLTDLGSRNGTRIDDRKVAGTAEVEPGQTIRVGRVELVLLVDDAREEPRGEPKKVIGPFEIHRVLGRGGVGVVLEVYDTRRREWLAVKMLHEKTLGSSRARERFLQEARIMTRLDHPGIVSAVEVGEVEGLPYIAMPFLKEATDLEKRVRERGPGPVREAVLWAIEAGEALAHAHARSIVHRDIKPANLLLDEHDRVRILDFGVAAALDATGCHRLTASGAVLGSPYFMPPEQIGSARHVDGRSDVYSLGATLFYLLTGEYPFPKGDFLSVCRKIIGSSPLSLAQVRPDAPAPLAAAISRAMERDPARRFPSAEEFVAALREIAG